MSDNNLNTFVNLCSNLVQSSILTPIVQYLSSKGVDVTVEELVSVLQLPTTRSIAMVPGMSFGGVAPPMATSVEKRTRVAAVDDSTVRRCTRIISKGANEGNPCNKVLKAGEEEVCKACSTKGKRAPAAKKAAAVPKKRVAGKKAAALKEDKEEALPTEEEEEETVDESILPKSTRTISVVPYNAARHWFREAVHGFIILNKDPAHPASVFGKLNDNEEIVALTADDKVQARNMGFNVIDLPTEASA